MRFSIFTPTHRPDYLLEAYESLLAQSFADWEWVIVPNGKDEVTIPQAIREDARVRIVQAPSGLCGVGALKRFACGQCSGEFLVELDHDDLLTEHALAAIDHRITNDNADFLYSDSANFRADGTCQIYGGDFGWVNYPYEYKGRVYGVNKAFDLTPSSLAAIHYAPNHVRVWRASTYAAVGGHDALLEICDDYDLIVRTYLSGAKFSHIAHCLYLYRMQTDGNNTFLQRNAEIQTKQKELGDRYMRAITAEWCRRNDYPMYDLGGGINPARGYKSIDILPNANIVCDITKGLPLPASSVGCIRAADFLEHVPHCRDSRCKHKTCTVALVNEIYRVLVPGGLFISTTPSTDGRGAWQDPTHCSGWNPNSFWYYTRRQQAQFVPGIKARFQAHSIRQDFPSDWHKQHNIPYVSADLVALKGQRQPGICEV